MADEDTNQAAEPQDQVQPTPVPDTPAEAVPIEEKSGFLATTLGKIVVIGGAIGVLLVIAAVVTFAVVQFVVDSGEDAVESMIEATVPPATPGGEAEVAENATKDGIHTPVKLSDVHVFRDIFQPLLTPVPVEEEDADGGPTNGGSEDTTDTANGSTEFEANTLYLLEISTQDGDPVARFHWNGTEYIAKEGVQLGDTPWRVLSIGQTSVTMQFGDSQLSLSVGQGITK